MNVFHRFTRRSLRENRSRTWVTVIGIILSVALFTAVAEGGYSGVQYLVRTEETSAGRFHGLMSQLTAQEAEALSREPGMAELACWQEVGWGYIGSENQWKPYLKVVSMDETLPQLLAIRVTAGRLPEKPGELLIPEHLLENGNVSLPVGSAITLSLGQRMLDGESVECDWLLDGETLVDGTYHSYTVVGTYQRLSYAAEGYECPGYTAITCGESGDSYTAFFRVQQPRTIYSDLSGRSWTPHTTLLNYSGATGHGNVNSVIYSMAAILMLLIVFGSVSLIYNSFSISVSQRTRQFGILKSIGATKAQIRGSVLYEALLLCAVAIPAGLLLGCAGIGVTLYCLRDSFGFLTGDSVSVVQMQLVLNPWALLISVAVGLITALISAWIPARRAVRITAMEAIRQSRDVRIRGRELRTGLLPRLFGFPGLLAAKNFKRDRKRYRATILGLFLSVTLFVSASSFCSYLSGAAKSVEVSSGSSADLEYTERLPEDVTAQQRLTQLLAAQGVDGGTYTVGSATDLWLSADCLHAEYLAYPNMDTDSKRLLYPRLLFVADEEYRRLLQENGLDEADYFNADVPLALALDQYSLWGDDGSGEKRYTFHMLSESALPISGLRLDQWKDIPGWFIFDSSVEYREDGVACVRYWPQEYLEDIVSDKLPDSSLSRLVPLEEAATGAALTIGAILDEAPYYAQGDRLELLYPHSLYEAVMGQALSGEDRVYVFSFQAEAHAAAYESMGTLLAQSGLSRPNLRDLASDNEASRAMVTVVRVFSYGFIVLISLISMANVFNTISTSIALRRREFAMLRSVGLTQRDFGRMMNYECLNYGLRALLWSLPASALMTWLIYSAMRQGFGSRFLIPWASVAVAVGSVFVVVFATMLYATRKIRGENPIDGLRQENL